MHNDECPEPLILRFYLAKDGSLVCRATESATNRSWFIRRPAALKALLGRMTERGVTIFLTSHVMEIVERLCSHVAIIHKGHLVAQGSLDELRAGIPGTEGLNTTLEQIFLSIVGQRGAEPQVDELSWLM